MFGPEKGKGGNIGKSDEELIRDLISIHNAENWLGMDGDSDLSMFKPSMLNFDDDEKGKYSYIQTLVILKKMYHERMFSIYAAKEINNNDLTAFNSCEFMQYSEKHT